MWSGDNRKKGNVIALLPAVSVKFSMVSILFEDVIQKLGDVVQTALAHSLADIVEPPV